MVDRTGCVMTALALLYHIVLVRSSDKRVQTDSSSAANRKSGLHEHWANGQQMLVSFVWRAALLTT